MPVMLTKAVSDGQGQSRAASSRQPNSLIGRPKGLSGWASWRDAVPIRK